MDMLRLGKDDMVRTTAQKAKGELGVNAPGGICLTRGRTWASCANSAGQPCLSQVSRPRSRWLPSMMWEMRWCRSVAPRSASFL